MDKYIFYYKGDDIQAIPKAALSRKLKAEFSSNGFKKHPITVMASNEQAALGELQNENNLNLSMLSEYSGGMFIIALTMIPVLIIAVVALFLS